jgi:hypothetical protein
MFGHAWSGGGLGETEQELRRVHGVSQGSSAATPAKKLPFISDFAEKIDESVDAVKRLGMRKADEVISGNAAHVVNSMGATMLNSLHDHAMPTGVHGFVDDVFGSMWPEVKKSIMDAVMLGQSLEFKSIQKLQAERDPEPPRGVFRRMAARLIYAMEPYDLTIWGVLRSPLSVCIQVCFYFPLYGISDVMILTLAASKCFTNFDEYGLIQFIVSSKRLQFVTAGLFSGTYAFTRLFICATLREDATSDGAAAASSLPSLPASAEPSYFACENFAPGGHGTFIFELCLFLVRSILNWVAFVVLWNFDGVVRTQRQQARVRKAQQHLVVGTERRALYPALSTGFLLLLTWQIAFAVTGLIGLSIVYRDPPSPSSPSSSVPVLDALRPYLDVLCLCLALQLYLHRLLTRPMMTSAPARLALALSLAATVYFAARFRLAPADLRTPAGVAAAAAWPGMSGPAGSTGADWVRGGAWSSLVVGAKVHAAALVASFDGFARLTAAVALLNALVSACIAAGLVRMQGEAHRRDQAAVERLRRLMEAVDTDHSGSVSKVEMRKKYAFFFSDAASLVSEGISDPRFDARDFEQFWAQVDSKHEERVTLADLANEYGVAHLLITPTEDWEAGVGGGRNAALDPRYIEKRLEELHRREFGEVQRRPGGALLYFVVWDACAFITAVAFALPFLWREMVYGGLHTLSATLADWRVRCGLYFLKVAIALLSFPFLLFALPLVQEWLTHAKPTGYDLSGTCVPRLNSSQIKAKFRHKFLEAKRTRGDAHARSCWDRAIGVDPEAELSIDEALQSARTKAAPSGGPQTASVVEAARRRRRQQVREDRLPEASLLLVDDGAAHLKGKLQFKGDPSSLLML